MESTDSIRQSKNSGINSSPDSTISVSEIFDFVKKNNDLFESDSYKPTAFTPKSVDSSLLNQDGTPKVFYHGYMDVLYSINSKENGTAALNAPPVSTPDYRTTISVADLLDYVNMYFPDILPEDVLKHYGYTERPYGQMGSSALFSERTEDFESLVKEYSSDLVSDYAGKKTDMRVKIANLAKLSNWKRVVRMLRRVKRNCLTRLQCATGGGAGAPRQRDWVRRFGFHLIRPWRCSAPLASTTPMGKHRPMAAGASPCPTTSS